MYKPFHLVEAYKSTIMFWCVAASYIKITFQQECIFCLPLYTNGKSLWFITPEYSPIL